MKTVVVALLLFLAFVAGVCIYRARLAVPADAEPVFASLDEVPDRGPMELPPARPVSLPDDSDAMLRRLEQVLAKLENLEVSVREARTEITLRSDERSRTAVTAYPANATSRLGDQDLDNLRTLLREELVNEAWIQRQDHMVGIARHLALQLALEPKTIDPLIEVLCADERVFFDLERELAVRNHERGVSKRRALDFRDARRKLRQDLGSIYRDDELAARIFLHVVSHGEVAALQLGRDNLLAIEKEWLR